MINAVAVFALMLLFEFVWAKCVWSLNESSPVVAAAWSTGFYLVSTLVVLEVVGQPLLLGSAAAGAFIGTYWVVRRKRANHSS